MNSALLLCLPMRYALKRQQQQNAQQARCVLQCRSQDSGDHNVLLHFSYLYIA